MADDIRIGSTIAIPDYLKTNPEHTNGKKKRRGAAPSLGETVPQPEPDESLTDDDTDHHQLDVLI